VGSPPALAVDSSDNGAPRREPAAHLDRSARSARGILTRHQDNLELYRVRDYKVTEPFWLRLFGLGNLVVSSMDVSSPSLEIRAIRDPNGRREELRKYVELCRDKKRVRVTEFES